MPAAYPLRVFLVCALATGFRSTEADLAQKAPTSAPAPSSAPAGLSTHATFTFLALEHDGTPVTDLRAEELSLRIDKRQGLAGKTRRICGKARKLAVARFF
jgi:hypothetical protein